MMKTSHCCSNCLSARGRVRPNVWHSNYANRGTHTKNILFMLLNCFKVVRNFFPVLFKSIFLWVISTPLDRLMSKSWNRKTAQQLISWLLDNFLLCLLETENKTICLFAAKYYSMPTRNPITRAVASNRLTEALASVISFFFGVIIKKTLKDGAY